MNYHQRSKNEVEQEIEGIEEEIKAMTTRKVGKLKSKVSENEKESQIETQEQETPKAQAFQANITMKEDVDRMMVEIKECFNKLPDILINNALGNFQFNGDARKKFEDLPWEDMQGQLDVTLKGSFHLIQALIPSMKEKHFGKIINIGTNLFHNPVVPYHDYIAGKGALLALTRSLAKELGEFGIRVNMVSGGLLKVTQASACTPTAVFDIIATSTPLQEVTSTQSFAEGVVMLVGSMSNAITGQNLTIDGGLTFN